MAGWRCWAVAPRREITVSKPVGGRLDSVGWWRVEEVGGEGEGPVKEEASRKEPKMSSKPPSTAEENLEDFSAVVRIASREKSALRWRNSVTRGWPM